MSNPSSPPVARFSLRNVLVLVVPLALIALGVWWYLTNEAERDMHQSDRMHVFLKNNLKAPTKLDSSFIDGGDLVAATPKDAKDQIDPETLEFSVLGSDLEKEQGRFRELTAHIGKVTGKKVNLIVWTESVDEQMQALRDGKLHLALLSTGSVSTAVNKGGIVPFCTMADANGKFGYHMEIIVPADSPIKGPADLKGQSVAFASAYSHSGFKAPIVILWKEFGLQPGRDYSPPIIGGQELVIEGVAKGQLKAGAVASDLLKRMTAPPNTLDPKSIRSIYKSKEFPPNCFGYAHQLKPELAAKIKTAFLEFPWAGTSLEKEYAAAGQSKFVAISYKTDWAPIREMDEQASKLMAEEVAQAKK